MQGCIQPVPSWTEDGDCAALCGKRQQQVLRGIGHAASHMLPKFDFWEADVEPTSAKSLILNGTAAPARTGDPQIHNLVL